MAGFFKTFFLGILYVVLSPFIALLLALYFVYCIFVFIYMGIRNIIVFFAGGTPMGDLPEDVKAKKILIERAQQPSKVIEAMGSEEKASAPVAPVSAAPSTAPVSTAPSTAPVQPSSAPVQNNTALKQPEFPNGDDEITVGGNKDDDGGNQ